MAKTPAQKQREYRERQKDRARIEAPKAETFLRSSFADFLKSDAHGQELSFIDETLDSFGIHNSPDLTKDEDPEWREEWGYPNRGALSRAERMVGGLIDIARTLSSLINAYKVSELDAALAALQAADLSDPEAKTKALEDAARIADLKRRLSKEVRHAFPTISAKGE